MLQKERKKTRCRFFVLFFFFILIFRVCALTFPIVWWLCFNFKYFFGPFISVKLKQFWHFFFLARMRFFSVRFSFVYLYSNYAVFCCTRLILGRYIYFVYDFRTFVLLFSWVSTVDAVAYIAVTVAVAVVVAATAAAAAVVAHCFVSKTIFGLFRWLRAVLSLKHCFTFLSLTLHCVLNLDICWTFNIRHGFFLSLSSKSNIFWWFHAENRSKVDFIHRPYFVSLVSLWLNLSLIFNNFDKRTTFDPEWKW